MTETRFGVKTGGRTSADLVATPERIRAVYASEANRLLLARDANGDPLYVRDENGTIVKREGNP